MSGQQGNGRKIGTAVTAMAMMVAVLVSPSVATAHGGPLPSAGISAAPVANPGPNSVSAFGTAVAVSGPAASAGAAPVVGMAATPDRGGYWLVGSDGGVFSFGDARFFGSLGGVHLSGPVVGVAASPDGGGYWLVGSDGGVFSFGDARFFGSLGGVHLSGPVVGVAATPDGGGYWLVGSDGGVFSFGDARFFGSLGGVHLSGPVVGVAASPDGGGYWLVGSDGGVFSFGDARFFGSLGGVHLSGPVVGVAASPDGGGYWLVGSDGGVFNFGDAPFLGSDGGARVSNPAVAITGRPGGYWIAYGQTALVPSIASLVDTRIDNVTAAVYDINTGQTFTFRPGVVEHTASTLKVDILATLLSKAQAAGRGLTPEEQSLAVPMITESLDSAADTLWVRLGPGAVGAFERAAGLTQTVPATDGIWGTTTTTALDRLAMVRTVVFPNPLLTNASRAYILNLMEHITPSQAWGISGGVPPGVTVALKNGFAVINGWQINSAGWVNGQGRNYLIAVLTDGNPTESYGIDTINAISAIVWNALAP